MTASKVKVFRVCACACLAAITCPAQHIHVSDYTCQITLAKVWLDLSLALRDEVSAHGCMQGYTTRDRRSAHVRQADEAAEAVLAAGANGDITGAADMEGAADMASAAGGASGLFKQDSEFQMLVQTCRLLLKQGRLTEAKSLIDSSIRLFAK